jgi:hypothetical protein
MITHAEQVRDLASECRSIAEITENADANQQLLDVAAILERLATPRRAEPPPLKATR